MLTAGGTLGVVPDEFCIARGLRLFCVESKVYNPIHWASRAANLTPPPSYTLKETGRDRPAGVQSPTSTGKHQHHQRPKPSDLLVGCLGRRGAAQRSGLRCLAENSKRLAYYFGASWPGNSTNTVAHFLSVLGKSWGRRQNYNNN